MTFPKKITPCPIIEATVEIRFEPLVPAEAVFGVLYNEFKIKFSHLENLPVLQLPEQIRTKDPNLIFQPYYKLYNDNKFSIRIGPRIVSIACTEQYIGWQNFLPQINNIYDAVKKANIVKGINRFGLRYINFFAKTNIFNSIKLGIRINDRELSNEQTYLNTTMEVNSFKSTLQISNNATISHDGQNKIGSIVDIDISSQNIKNNFFDTSAELVEEAHTKEKEVFFGLLKDNFLKTLNPEY